MIKNIALTIMAAIVAVQMLILGILALGCNNAVLGFFLGVALPESIRLLPKMEDEA